jgi:hypothetical protein
VRVLQVHHLCAPRQLLEFLVSQEAELASSAADKQILRSMAEDELLIEAKNALGARHVVRMCSREHIEDVSDALQRLLENAAAIRSSVDLEGVCLAIDDNYHLWDSGYVSIPYNFDIKTVASEVTKLLMPASDASAPESPAAAAPARDAATAQPATPERDRGMTTTAADAGPRPAERVKPAAFAAAKGSSFLSGLRERARKASRTKKMISSTDEAPEKWNLPPLPPLQQPFPEMCSLLEDAAAAADAASFQKQLQSLTTAVARAKEAGSVKEGVKVHKESKEGAGTSAQPAFSRSAVVPASLLMPHMQQYSRSIVRRAHGAPSLAPPLPPPPPPQPPRGMSWLRGSVRGNALAARSSCRNCMQLI